MSTSELPTISFPTATSPHTSAATAPGSPFRSRTGCIRRVTAIAQSGVVGDGFQIVLLPVIMAMAKFQPYTATC